MWHKKIAELAPAVAEAGMLHVLTGIGHAVDAVILPMAAGASVVSAIVTSDMAARAGNDAGCAEDYTVWYLMAFSCQKHWQW